MAARPAELRTSPPGRHRATPGRRTALRTTITSLLVALVLLLSAGVTGLLPARILRVTSDSMTPTLSAGDLVLALPGTPRRRDLVVVQQPGWGGPLVKRAVAIGGDRVAIEDGVLTIDGSEVCEPNLDPDRIDGVFFPPFEVPDGELFLLSDDRRDGVDSRDFGTVRASDVDGLVRGRLWPSPGGLLTATC